MPTTYPASELFARKFHDRVFISSPWAHQASTEFVAMAEPDSTERCAKVHGTVSVHINTGTACVALRATPAELRKLAELLNDAADEKDAM